MALIQAEILTPWEQVEEDGLIYRWPLVSSQFNLRKWQDITGQDAANLIPDPNLLSILVEADETVIEQVKLDLRFLVLWEEFA